jgi:predicted  nucleic acid-binding Zn-ribbon protein
MGDLREVLLVLSRCERRREELGRDQEVVPRQIAEAEGKIQSARERVAAQKAALAAAEQERRAREGALQTAETQRTKFQNQTAQVKTNAEYHALLHEIEVAGQRISEIETEILTAMDAVDAAGVLLKQVVREQADIEKVLVADADRLRARLVEVEREAAQNEQERQDIVVKLPADARGRYERVWKARGTGTSLIAGRSCASCHRDVPYESINRALAGESQPCMNCGRLLVPADDA